MRLRMGRLVTSQRFLLAACVLSLLAAAVPIAIGVFQQVQLQRGISEINGSHLAADQAHEFLGQVNRSLPGFTAVALSLDADERRAVNTRTDQFIGRMTAELDGFLDAAGAFASPDEATAIRDALEEIRYGWEEIGERSVSPSGMSEAEKTFRFLKLLASLDILRSSLSRIDDRIDLSLISAVDAAVDNVDRSQMMLIAALLGAAMIGMIAVYSNFRFAWQMRAVNEELTRHRDHLHAKAAELEQALGKEQELNLLQSQFVTMASHEFRTPLAIISGAAQRLRRRADRLSPEVVTAGARTIEDAVKRMVRLMESTLMAERIHDGRIEVEIGTCDIGATVQEVCERQQELDQTHVIRCRLDNLPGTIRADAAAIDQVLTNLLSNAVKYSAGAPEIEVVALGEGDEVVISVSDQGLGIDEDDLPRMFARYFRAKTSTGIAGTGIGLNLSMLLVNLHRGSMTVESRKGEGSTFTVHLPFGGPEAIAPVLCDAA